MIKKRIKIQLKKAVSMFMGAALPGIMCTILLSVCLAGCKSIPAKPEKDQAGENQQQEQMKESKDTDPGQEKKTQAGKDTQNSGKSTAQDDGSTAGPPVIWNRKMPEDVVLPASYDYREQGRAPKIGNQGSLGTCWAFASLTALESTLLPDQKETFSVDHMSMHNHFLLGQDEGGEYTMSMAYLLSWEGPVWESEDPYGDGISPDGLKAREHVQEIQILPSKDYEAIKRAVYLEGGVQSSLYTSMQDYESESIYYNRDTNSYCYIGTEKPNHDSVIVGWDDDFRKKILIWIWKETEPLYVLTAGAKISEIRDIFMYLIMILILESIILYTRELNLLTIMTRSTRVIFAAGWVRSGMGKIQPGLPMLIAQKKGKSWRQPVFMQQGRIQNIRSMWHVIFRTRTAQMLQEKTGSVRTMA